MNQVRINISTTTNKPQSQTLGKCLYTPTNFQIHFCNYCPSQALCNLVLTGCLLTSQYVNTGPPTQTLLWRCGWSSCVCTHTAVCQCTTWHYRNHEEGSTYISPVLCVPGWVKPAPKTCTGAVGQFLAVPKKGHCSLFCFKGRLEGPQHCYRLSYLNTASQVDSFASKVSWQFSGYC